MQTQEKVTLAEKLSSQKVIHIHVWSQKEAMKLLTSLTIHLLQGSLSIKAKSTSKYSLPKILLRIQTFSFQTR